MEVDLPDSLEAVRIHLVPQIRERFTWELMKLNARLEGNEEFEGPPFQTIAGDLSVEVVFDMPRSTRTITRENLDAWGTDFDSVLEIARQNLREASAPNFKRISPGVYVSQWRDTFDAARMSTTDVLFDLEVKGHHVVFIPHRDEMVVTGTLEEAGLSSPAQYVAKSLQAPRPITGRAYRLGGVEWFPYLPESEHPAFNALKELAMNNLAGCYSEQQNYLEKLSEKRGEDIYVGSQILAKDPSGTPQSISVWTKGIVTLLAEADFVYFVDPDKKESKVAGEVRWERALEVLSAKMEPQGLFPERYRVTDFPTEEELSTLTLTPSSKPSVQ